MNNKKNRFIAVGILLIPICALLLRYTQTNLEYPTNVALISIGLMVAGMLLGIGIGLCMAEPDEESGVEQVISQNPES